MSSTTDPVIAESAIPPVEANTQPDAASLNASMTKEEMISFGQELSEKNTRLKHLSFSQTYKDLQEAIVEFLHLPCCSELESLEYLASGSSFGQIILSPSTDPTSTISSEKLQDKEFIQQQIPFAKTLKILRLGYNSDKQQSQSDISILRAVLGEFTQLEEFSMLNSLDNLELVEGLKASSELKKLSLAVNNEAGISEEEAIEKIREELKKTVGEETEQNIEVQVEIDERESSYYLNVARDRHFQAFLRRFGGDLK